MSHDEVVKKKMQFHRQMLDALGRHRIDDKEISLPKGVKRDKLEEAYSKMEDYELKLVKKKKVSQNQV
ncbi:MAG: hypothetical protein LVQ97_04170 [Candidatus Micrarchaeales archaeon]|jgi:hypothetical protein|nr:hypothetical protein [Candidatus Micrarchaeales archaeon]